ncbi:hypothetical protein [Ileibacterium valens]|uniref:hypothetical protein n=1 Tax=Ileibacterium valens TaxID=1862668 RepID=UPI00235440EE|nr:hypothetical protein [Ileibacterium valens]
MDIPITIFLTIWKFQQTQSGHSATARRFKSKNTKKSISARTAACLSLAKRNCIAIANAKLSTGTIIRKSVKAR